MLCFVLSRKFVQSAGQFVQSVSVFPIGSELKKTNAISPFYDASRNKNIVATIRIGQEIWCLPNAGFFIEGLYFLIVCLRLAPLNNTIRVWYQSTYVPGLV